MLVEVKPEPEILKVLGGTFMPVVGVTELAAGEGFIGDKSDSPAIVPACAI